MTKILCLLNNKKLNKLYSEYINVKKENKIYFIEEPETEMLNYINHN